MFRDQKRHELIVQSGKLLDQCRGCKIWQEACRHTHNPETICTGCTIYEKLRGIGYMLSAGDREKDRVRNQTIRRALADGRSRNWVVRHMQVGRAKVYWIYDRMQEKAKANG